MWLLILGLTTIPLCIIQCELPLFHIPNTNILVWQTLWSSSRLTKWYCFPWSHSDGGNCQGTLKPHHPCK